MYRQIVDTGLDYNSCYFVDKDGKEVAHGHYFEEMGVQASALSSWNPSFSFTPELAQVFTGGDFSFDLSRRKVRLSAHNVGRRVSGFGRLRFSGHPVLGVVFRIG